MRKNELKHARQRDSGGGATPTRESSHESTQRWASSRGSLRGILLRLAASIGVPLVSLFLLELGLRLAGYGCATGFWVRDPRGRGVVTNDTFLLLYFPPVLARQPVPTLLAVPKPADTYRIFLLGSSAAQGFPDPDGAWSAARMLEVMLQDAYPLTRFEVANVAMTAINSHAFLSIARDCAAHQPDLFMVYGGNNEVVGPYGPETVFRGYSPSRKIMRAGIAARQTRTGQLLTAILGHLHGDSSEFQEWGGMETFCDHQVATEDPRMSAVYRRFRENLEDLRDVAQSGGARVLLCTVAVNLRDCPPFASLHRHDLTAAQRADFAARYQQAHAAERRGLHDRALGTLAAAYARTDRFDDAVEIVTRAVTLAAAAGHPTASLEQASLLYLGRQPVVMRFGQSRRSRVIE